MAPVVSLNGDDISVVSLGHSATKLSLLAAVRPKQRDVNTTARSTDGINFNKKCLKIQYFFVTLPTLSAKTTSVEFVSS